MGGSEYCAGIVYFDLVGNLKVGFLELTVDPT